MRQCVICERNLAASKQDSNLHVCHRKECQAPYKKWATANWDLLGDSKYKTKYEDEFWEVTPEQKTQFSAFFALMRPEKRKIRKRNCLRCKIEISSGCSTREDHRICSQCHRRNQHVGALAVV